MQETVAPALRVDRVTRTYPSEQGPLTVVADVSFAVGRGETCAIVGPSGSGKTTLLGLCAGLDRPTSGDIELDGVSLTPLDEEGRSKLRSERVGFVFQSFQLLPTLTALENVMIPLELRGDASAGKEARAWLDRVGLGGRMSHYPSQLSGGEQQRVALARAFVHRPRVLFADEPTGNLDLETSRKVVDLLFGLNAEVGTSLILVTHDLELAARTQRVIRLRGGKQVEGS